MKLAKVTIIEGKAGRQKGKWRYKIEAANGEFLVQSEGHTSCRDAQRAFDSLVRACDAYTLRYQDAPITKSKDAKKKIKKSR